MSASNICNKILGANDTTKTKMDQDGPAGRKSGAQRKTGLVGERQLQPYAPHGVKRTN